MCSLGEHRCHIDGLSSRQDPPCASSLHFDKAVPNPIMNHATRKANVAPLVVALWQLGKGTSRTSDDLVVGGERGGRELLLSRTVRDTRLIIYPLLCAKRCCRRTWFSANCRVRGPPLCFTRPHNPYKISVFPSPIVYGQIELSRTAIREEPRSNGTAYRASSATSAAHEVLRKSVRPQTTSDY